MEGVSYTYVDDHLGALDFLFLGKVKRQKSSAVGPSTEAWMIDSDDGRMNGTKTDMSYQTNLHRV